MGRITPFLWFDTESQEAAEFYTSVFPNSKITKVTTRPDRSDEPVLTVEFELDGQRFIALNGGPQFSFTEAVSFDVKCQTQEDVDGYWETLSEGGEVWAAWAHDVRAATVPGGHFIPEEAPKQLAAALLDFLG